MRPPQPRSKSLGLVDGAIGDGEVADAGIGQGKRDRAGCTPGTGHVGAFALRLEAGYRPKRHDEADAVEHRPHHTAVRLAPDAIDSADVAGFFGHPVAEPEHGRLVRHGCNEPAEILHRLQTGYQRHQPFGLDMEGDQHRVHAVTGKDLGHDLRRLHVMDRIGENTVDAGLARDPMGGCIRHAMLRVAWTLEGLV